ncbi:MAG: alpha/beta fold hydrolase [Limnobacter sp.]|nr:alpha/beta fold hydrolase [Limnobacter sp.]
MLQRTKPIPAPSTEVAATLPAANDSERLDRQTHAAIGRLTSSLSPTAGLLAFMDWACHLSVSPGKQFDLLRLALQNAQRLSNYARDRAFATPDLEARHSIVKPTDDPRFAHEDWQYWPFNLTHQAFLLTQQWWSAATHGVRGVSKHHEDLVSFAARQLLDVVSPGNYLFTSPVVLRRTLEQGGANLMRGAMHALDDFERLVSGAPPAGTEDFVVGRDVGITPGKVVLKNRLIELIQYSPTTDVVHPEPILIVPAWIMKYYILDLSPHNSLVRYLVSQGHTVFCISWKNPGSEDRDLGMDDYLDLGLRAAIDTVEAIVPGQRIHATGYCLGGTLLSIGAAAMARDGDDRLASFTLFAAQTDFTEPGELALFIDDSQVSLLDAQMAETGYLTAAQMAGAFQLLRSYDLLWSRIVNEYLMGDRASLNDLMAWNADATRMPARMHSEYLRRLFLNNDLAEGRYKVDGRLISMHDLRVPAFAVGTVKDHVAPWRSAFKLHSQIDSELTFVLTSGGHNAGIVSPPGHPRRNYQLLVRAPGDPSLGPDEWVERAPKFEGSWWPAWLDWLKARSGEPVAPPRMGPPGTSAETLPDAPGSYVLEK